MSKLKVYTSGQLWSWFEMAMETSHPKQQSFTQKFGATNFMESLEGAIAT